MEEHIYDLLTASIAWDIAWGSLGEDASLPRAALFSVGGLSDMTMRGPGITLGRIQIDVYAETYVEALAASREVQAILNGYKGGPILGCFLVAKRDGDDADSQLLQRISLTFSINYRE